MNLEMADSRDSLKFDRKYTLSGIRGAVDILRDFGHRDTEIKTIIMQKYSLTDKDANEYL